MKKSVIYGLVFVVLLGGVLFYFLGNKKGPRDLDDLEFTQQSLKNDANLAWFYAWTKEDPLFTSPDFESEFFSKGIDALESEEKGVLSYMKTQTNVYPIPFLRDVATIDSLHDNFLKDPTREKAKELVDKYYQAIENYKTADEELLNEVTDIASESKTMNRNFATLNIVTTPSVIISDLKKIEQNSDKLKEEVNKRKSCLENGTTCARPTFNKPKINKEIATFKESDFLPRKTLLPLLDDKVIVRGPYIIQTPCLGWNEDLTAPSHPIYVYEEYDPRDFVSGGKLPIQMSRVATTRYFVRADKDNALKALVSPLGLTWAPVEETNIYRCADSRHQNVTAAVDSLYGSYKDSWLFSKFTDKQGLPSQVNSVLKDGLKLEEAFFKAQYPSDVDADNLSKYYGYVYSQIGNWKRDENYSKADWFGELYKSRDEFLKRYLSYDRKLSNIHLVLNRAVGTLASYRIRSIFHENNVKTTMYLIRTMYGLSYLPFSPSVYRLDEPLDYLDKRLVNSVNPNAGYMNYQQAVETYGKDVVDGWDDIILKVTNDAYKEHEEELKLQTWF